MEDSASMKNGKAMRSTDEAKEAFMGRYNRELSKYKVQRSTASNGYGIEDCV